MKAVLLDEVRFNDELELTPPEALSDYVVYRKTPQDKDTIIERCQDADIIISSAIRFTRDIIESLPKLKLIQLSSVGMNSVDAQACKDNNVALYNVPGFATQSVAEHTFMLMLNAMRGGLYYHHSVADNSWKSRGRKTLLNEVAVRDINQLTLGIIGVGDIGKQVSELARAFGMTVLWADHQDKTPRNADYTDFDTVLEQSDIIGLHTPLTDETRHLINKDTLAKMKQQPLIVNVARGGVVDAAAVAEAIQNEQIFGYATDVFEKEPAPLDDPIVALANQHHPRVILTPHVAASTKAAEYKLWQTLREQVTDFVKQHS